MSHNLSISPNTIVPSGAISPIPTDLLKDLVLTSDHGSPVSIEGVAHGSVRGRPDLQAFYLVYKYRDSTAFFRLQVTREAYDIVREAIDHVKIAFAEGRTP